MTDVCAICADSFTSKTRKKIACPFDCGIECCLHCIKTQFHETDHDIQCMGCRKPYTNEQLSEIFSQNYLRKDFKARRAEILFDREKAKFPDTMNFVAQLKEAEEIEKQHKLLQKRNAELRAEMEQNNEIMAEMSERINNLREGKIKEERKQTFHQRCCKEDCQGFVNLHYVCKVCETKTCKDCLQEKTEGHECDKDIVATVAAIKKDCKNCPKCATSIYKIEGCDQMWCTSCHTTFSWKTGQEVTGVIHNPHYFQFMRENEIGRAHV